MESESEAFKNGTTSENSKQDDSIDDTAEIDQEAKLSQIRNLMNENKIKLWLPPYFSAESGPSDANLLELASTLAPSLNFDVMVVLKGITNLQKNALDKLAARSELSSTGKITLKIKLSKSLNLKLGDKQSISIDAKSSGKQLLKEVSEMAGCNPEDLMIISGGKTLKEDVDLAEQGLKAGATVMLVKINRNEKSWSVVQEQKKLLQLAKNDARILGSSDDLQITNQKGESIDLPVEEKNALIMAMSLHEKGKEALKKGNYDIALIFLLEASVEYDICRAEILKVADNYGLLNLDIVWCYLQLGNVSELPNADERLKDCEKSLKRSYGQNLERLNSMRGEFNAESALLLRLNLLRAVVAFHNGHKTSAVNLFRDVESDLQRLEVPEDLIDEVAAQGFTRREARLALRAVNNKVPAAVRFAQEAVDKKKEIEKKESEKRARRIRLGKTIDGSWVNIGYLETIMGYGYSEELAAAALKQTCNDIDAAMKALYDDIETLMVIATTNEAANITSEMVTQLQEMGFSVDIAREALVKSQGNIEKALNDLMGRKEEEKILEQAAKRAKRDARSRMDETLDGEDDYLDLTLAEEKKILDKYKKIIESQN